MTFRKKYDSIKKMIELNAKTEVYTNFFGENILYMFNVKYIIIIPISMKIKVVKEQRLSIKNILIRMFS